MNLDRKAFESATDEEIGRLVRQAGVRVCVLPINGTRRWFALEHGAKASENPVESYLAISGRRHIELYRLIYDHGIDTLVTPVVGPDIMTRGERYKAVLEPGLTWFAQDSDFRSFYSAYDVRVRIYGDAKRCMEQGGYASALDAYAQIEADTSSHRTRRLLFGVCANDAAESVAKIGICFHREHGRPPSKRELVEAYYGEYVEPVDLFVGFDRLAAYDMPLIATGREALYFMVSPSLYLDRQSLRAILYDYLYARQIDDDEYNALTSEDWREMKTFYDLNRHAVLGVGRKSETGHFWHPMPQVKLPASLRPGINESQEQAAEERAS